MSSVRQMCRVFIVLLWREISVNLNKTNLLTLMFAMSLLIITTTTFANNNIVNFNLPKQNADLSIVDFAEQANITLLFPLDKLEGITTNEVIGWYNVSRALFVLLANTGLKAEIDHRGQFSIVIDPSFKENNKQFTKTGEITESSADKLSNMATSQKMKQTARKNRTEMDEMEVITISGVRGSISQSINNKRFSTEIKDSISAEDIGQLPDENIAEALQRVTGIQMTRAPDGEGTSIQIRGLSNNNVEINGQTASGSGADRSVNFQDIPSELFSGIEILKAPTADKIEGSLGGTINLKTRRPLNIQEDQVGSITAKFKYYELSDKIAPDFNGFFAKNFRETTLGDLGFVLNFGRKELITQTDVFGGGSFGSAPAQWFRRSGGQVPAGNNNNNQFLADGPFQYIGGVNGDGDAVYGIDVNQDGIVDQNDSYYTSGGIRLFSRYVESQRDSLNFTLQWQPNNEANAYLDYSIADSEENLYGSQMSLAFNAARSFPINSVDYTSTPVSDDTYMIESGLIGATSVRMGGAPSIRNTWRESEKVTIGIDYQLSDVWLIESSFSVSSGSSKTKQAQLNMGYDWDSNNSIEPSDWAGMIFYDFSSGDIPNATFYQSPQHPTDGQQPAKSFDELVTLDPANLLYERLNYFQMQRNADDTKNEDTAYKLDLIHDIDGNFFSSLQVGARIASREFQRASYINTNQKDGFKVGGLVATVDIQDVKVIPDANEDPKNAQIAADLMQCFSADTINVGNTNLPNSWASTRCGSDFFTQYFDMHDIRAINSNSGSGYYENEGSRYDVIEDTQAVYFKADFFTYIGNMPLFGNFGVRYVKTQTESSGYLQNEPNIGTSASFSWLTLTGNYEDFIPSMNLNLSLNEDMLIRFAAYEAFSRPGLANLSPSIRLNYNTDIAGHAGTANMGNPNLEPIRSTNYDISYEWYYAADSLFSAALFNKYLESAIFVDAADKTSVEIGGELFLATQPQNHNGTSIKGLELNLQHSFAHLQGLLSNTGIGINYTYTNEDSKNFDEESDPIGRTGLSEHSYNLSAYYDDDIFSIRLTYNWRDDFVRRPSVSLGFNRPETLPEIEKARGQLDLTANYTINGNLKINLSAINLNESISERYMKYEKLVNYIAKSGVKYNLGLVYRF